MTDNWEAIIYGKEDNNALLVSHPSQTTFVSVTQTHGNEICVISPGMSFGKLPVCADALFSPEGISCGVYVADCLPVVLVNTTACAVVHCSWKTLYTGLLHKVITLFGENGQLPTHAYLGPCIKYYEVGKEFENYFPGPFLKPYNDKYLFDLVGYVQSMLLYYGLPKNSIVTDEGCTRNEANTYWGYRRGDHTERNFVGVRKIA